MNKKKTAFVGELIFGIHPVIELLKAKKRKLQSIYTTKPTPKAWSKIIELLPSYVNVQYVDRKALSKMAGTDDHQGVVGWAAPYVTRGKPFDPQKQPFLLMLDGVQDPKNLGAILRSAYCTNASGVIVTERDSAPITATALKSSAGLAEHLDVMITKTPAQTLQQLKASGYHLYLMTVDESQNATKVEYQDPLCVIIGSEGTGISKSLLNLGQHITLPQRNSEVSYNASVAAGIILFEIAIRKKFL